jgi:hypothetical protein
MPDEADVYALLALMLLHDSRRDARMRDGELVLLEEQNRSLWDRPAIQEGVELLERSIRLGANRPVGVYQLEAAIAALHAQADSADATDWAEIADLYRALQRIHDTPVVRLNRAVAVAMAEGPEAGLGLIDDVAVELDGFHPFHAARADLLRRAGRRTEAAAAYRVPSPCVPITSRVAISHDAWRKSAECRRNVFPGALRVSIKESRVPVAIRSGTASLALVAAAKLMLVWVDWATGTELSP